MELITNELVKDIDNLQNATFLEDKAEKVINF